MTITVKRVDDTAICALTNEKTYMTGKTQYGVVLSKNEVMKLADDLKNRGRSSSLRTTQIPIEKRQN